MQFGAQILKQFRDADVFRCLGLLLSLWMCLVTFSSTSIVQTALATPRMTTKSIIEAQALAEVCRHTTHDSAKSW